MFIRDFSKIKPNDLIELKYYNEVYILKVIDIEIKKGVVSLEGKVYYSNIKMPNKLLISFSLNYRKGEKSFRFLRDKEIYLYEL